MIDRRDQVKAKIKELKAEKPKHDPEIAKVNNVVSTQVKVFCSNE